MWRNGKYHDTTLMAESEEQLKSLLMKVKEENEKVDLKLKIQKMKITQEACKTYIALGPTSQTKGIITTRWAWASVCLKGSRLFPGSK